MGICVKRERNKICSYSSLLNLGKLQRNPTPHLERLGDSDNEINFSNKYVVKRCTQHQCAIYTQTPRKHEVYLFAKKRTLRGQKEVVRTTLPRITQGTPFRFKSKTQTASYIPSLDKLNNKRLVIFVSSG